VLFAFVGKDFASLVEISMCTAGFTLTYWPLVGSNLAGSDVFAMAFAYVYCTWGMHHIWAIACPLRTAMLIGVMVAFCDFLFCGIMPKAHELVPAFGGCGLLLLLACPNRWAVSHMLYQHAVGVGSTLPGSNTGHWAEYGFPLDKLPKTCPDATESVGERWRQGNGFACHTGQLYLLGVLFRFVAALCLLATSSAKASGGSLSLGAPSEKHARLVRNLIVIFVVFFVLLELTLLGLTH